jgi:hypothetical protein
VEDFELEATLAGAAGGLLRRNCTAIGAEAELDADFTGEEAVVDTDFGAEGTGEALAVTVFLLFFFVVVVAGFLAVVTGFLVGTGLGLVVLAVFAVVMRGFVCGAGTEAGGAVGAAKDSVFAAPNIRAHSPMIKFFKSVSFFNDEGLYRLPYPLYRGAPQKVKECLKSAKKAVF